MKNVSEYENEKEKVIANECARDFKVYLYCLCVFARVHNQMLRNEIGMKTVSSESYSFANSFSRFYSAI